MKTTVFAVECGEYSDYHVLGVYSTREKAQAMLNAIFRPNGDGTYKVGYGDDQPTIVEWDLDPGVEELQQGYVRFEVEMKRDGEVRHVREQIDGCGVTPRFYSHPWALRADVWAKNNNHAVKIVNERRAQMIANGEWPEKA
jgi:hypothetical protein